MMGEIIEINSLLFTGIIIIVFLFGFLAGYALGKEE